MNVEGAGKLCHKNLLAEVRQSRRFLYLEIMRSKPAANPVAWLKLHETDPRSWAVCAWSEKRAMKSLRVPNKELGPWINLGMR